MVDVLQVFILSSAIVGIGIIWIYFNVKVFQTVQDLMKAPFSEARPAARPAHGRRWINFLFKLFVSSIYND